MKGGCFLVPELGPVFSDNQILHTVETRLSGIQCNLKYRLLNENPKSPPYFVASK